LDDNPDFHRLAERGQVEDAVYPRGSDNEGKHHGSFGKKNFNFRRLAAF